MNVIRNNERPAAVLGFLRPLDTQRIATQLKLEQRGTERAKKELPNEKDVLLDVVEQDIIQYVEGEWTWQCGELINNLRAYSERLLGYSIPAEYEKLRLTAENALTELRAASKRALSELGPLQENYLERRKEYERFRERHKRVSLPNASPNRWTTIGLLSVLVAAEAVLNSFFFAKGSDYGLVGGVAIAVIISGINIVLAFFLGFGPARWLHHRNILIKLASLILLILGTGALFSLHAFAVHLREQTAIVGEEKAFAAAIKSISETPFQITDGSSIYLFLFGFVLGLLSLWKGHGFDEPYPRYGAVWRRMIAARSAYSAEHAILFDKLESIKNHAVKAILTGIDQIPSFPQYAAQVRMQRSALVESFRGYERSIVTSANQLLAKYRDANRAGRKSAAPSHFNQQWQLKTFAESPEVKQLLIDPTEERVDIGNTLKALQLSADAVLQDYSELLARYPHPSEMALP